MSSSPDLGSGLAFGVICLLFAAAGGYLLLQVIQRDMEGTTAAAIYAPLLLCWIGMGYTWSGRFSMIADILGFLAIAWCLLVGFRMLAVDQKIVRDLSDDRIAALQDWLTKHPEDLDSRFQLAECYEERGWPREAYQEYTRVLEIDPRHRLGHLRVRELYEEITRKPMPGVPQPAPPPPPPPESPDGVPRAAGPNQAEAVFQGRLAEFTGAIAKDPSNASLHASLGEELVRLGRIQEAADAYRKALWIDPGNERYRFNLYTLLEPEPELATIQTEASAHAAEPLAKPMAADPDKTSMPDTSPDTGPNAGPDAVPDSGADPGIRAPNGEGEAPDRTTVLEPVLEPPATFPAAAPLRVEKPRPSADGLATVAPRTNPAA
jgi:tetratricopeptide (TPR) repeat protein